MNCNSSRVRSIVCFSLSYLAKDINGEVVREETFLVFVSLSCGGIKR